MKLISLNMDPETWPAILHRPAGGEKKKKCCKTSAPWGVLFLCQEFKEQKQERTVQRTAVQCKSPPNNKTVKSSQQNNKLVIAASGAQTHSSSYGGKRLFLRWVALFAPWLSFIFSVCFCILYPNTVKSLLLPSLLLKGLVLLPLILSH